MESGNDYGNNHNENQAQPKSKAAPKPLNTIASNRIG